MTSILRLAACNLRRRPVRSLTTAAGVAIAVAALFSMASFQRGYQSGLRGEMQHLGAQVLVVPKGCPYDAASMALHGATWPCYLKSAYLDQVRSTEHVATAAPVLMTAIYNPANGSQVVYCGVDRSILPLKTMWKIDGHFSDRAGEILVGSEMAKQSRWQAGQTVHLPGLSNRSATVAGVLSPTGGADDLFVFMPLTDAQTVLNRPQQLTHILVRLDAAESLDSVVNNLRGCDAGLDMNVVPLAHIFASIQCLVENTKLLLGCVVLVALLAAGASVSNTMLMAITERTREIGVMRAVGISRGAIFCMVWAESVGLCVLGAGVGIGVAVVGSRAVESWLRSQLPFAPTEALIRLEWQVAVGCVVGSAVLGTLSGALPAQRASAMMPSEVLRR